MGTKLFNLFLWLMPGLGFLPCLSESAVLKRIQTGNVNLANQTVVTGTFGAVDTTKSIIIATGAVNTTRASRTHFTAQITNSTLATFTRNSNDATSFPINYTILEWAQGVTVERGGGFTTGTASFNRTITSVGTLEDGVALLTFRNTGPNNDIDREDFHRYNLTSTTNLRFNLATTSNNSAGYEFQIMTIPDVKVQRGSSSMGTAVQSSTGTISAVNVNKSWLIYDCSTTVTGTQMDDRMVVGNLRNAGTVAFAKYNNGGAQVCEYQVVEFLDNTRVQSGTMVIAAGATTGTATLPVPVKLDSSVALGGMFMRCGSSDFNTNDNPGEACGTFHLTTQGTLVYTRARSTNETTVPWTVISFPKRKISLPE